MCPQRFVGGYEDRAGADRGDSWTVRARLLGDVLEWAGEESLRYSLLAIAGGYVQRPLPYLERVLQEEVASGRRERDVFSRPVAAAVVMARELAPALEIVEVDDVLDAERSAERMGYLEDYRRRHGRLPWEPELGADGVGQKTCIGLNGV